MTLHTTWCNENIKNCISKIFSPHSKYIDCPIKETPYVIYNIGSEAYFWTSLYRLVEKECLDEIEFGIDVSDEAYYEIEAKTIGGIYWINDILKRIWAGERCYYYSYRYPKIISYRLSMSVDDYYKRSKYLNRKNKYKKEITDIVTKNVRELLGTFKSHTFNPLKRSIGLYCFLNDIKKNDIAREYLNNLLHTSAQSFDFEDLVYDHSNYKKLIRGTQKSIKTGRIYPIS